MAIETPSAFDLDAFMSNMDFGASELFQPGLLTDQYLSREETHPQEPEPNSHFGSLEKWNTPDVHSSPQASLSVKQPQQSSWRGSFEISETKREELSNEMKEMFCLVSHIH